MDPQPASLVVFSHRRWNAPRERPQQLLARLAGRWRISYVEEPVFDPGPPRFEVHDIAPCLEVLVPHTPVVARGFDDAQLTVLRALMRRHARRHALEGGVAWFYTPLALPLAETVAPACMVYDCMDDLAERHDAPALMRPRERALLHRAGLVLTAGPSLHEARRNREGKVHGLPNAVDAAAFEPGRLDPHCSEALQAHALQGMLPRPRLGFYGTLDERIDTALLARLADAHPGWSIVMVGPCEGLAPDTLPQRPNLHWLGAQPDAVLPHLLAQWDLALLPYATGGPTRFFNPPQTLEYMAAERPIVATPVPDVVALYGSMVEIGHGATGFLRACEQVLAEGREKRCARLMDMLTTVSTQSWARTADVVHLLLSKALQQARRARVRLVPPARPATPLLAAAGATSA